MAKKAVAKAEPEKKRGRGWREKFKFPTKKVELTEEELAAQQAEWDAEKQKHTGPIRSKKQVMGGSAHLCVRLKRETLDWLAAEAQIKSTTVSQIVRAWIETKERDAYKEQMFLIGRSE